MPNSFYNSPAGPLFISASDSGVTEIKFVNQTDQLTNEEAEIGAIIKDCIAQLEEYFSGHRKIFSVKLDPQGTPFQKEVWKQLQEIPFGKTMSYLELAKLLGDAKKIRAVGGANGKNPIAIIVPCHRVIGSDGSLIGYAGGMDKKRWLLKFEGSIQPDLFP